jgi:hypothetical protein
MLDVSSSSLGPLLLALRDSWKRETLICCMRSQLHSSLPFVRSLSCLSSNTSTNQQYCSLLHHDNFLLLCRLFARYHVCLPTHLLTNTALYCTMTTLQSLSRLDDHQEDEICSDLACLRLCCRGTYVLHDHVMKIHRHAVDGIVTKFLSVCVCVCVCTSATCNRYLYLFFFA